MTEPRRRPRASVGGRRHAHWHLLNTMALIMVGAGLIAVIAVSVRALNDGEDDPLAVGPIGPFRSATSTMVAPTPTPEPATPTATNETTRNEPATVTCGDILAPLDKEHRLDAGCAPGDLQELPSAVARGPQRMRAAAAAALAELVTGAKAAGFSLFAISAYRSYADQVAAYEENRAIYGDDVDRFSARPGHSEHQLGTTVDVSSAAAGYELEPFEGTPEAAWVAENSWRYGFIVSYPAGKEAITGYAHEPWHIRYVGKDVASRVRASGLTLHEYLLNPR